MRRLAMVVSVLLGSVLSLAQNGDLPSDPTKRRTNAPETTQPVANSNNGDTTGNSTHGSIITSDQQIQSSVQAEQNPDNAAGGGEVLSGMLINATLDLLLSSRSSEAGDHFTASVSDAVKAPDGSVLIPQGTKLEGIVIEAEQSRLASSLLGAGAKVSISFNRIVLPNGATKPISVTLVSVKNPKIDTASNRQGGTRNSEAVRQIGLSNANAAPGTKSEETLKGVSAGVSAGGGYVVATQAKLVELPPQTRLVLRLEHNLMVPASGPR